MTAPPAQRHLRLLPPRPLRLVDVALFHGGGSPALRAYLAAKQRFMASCDRAEHHMLVPGAPGPAIPFNRATGYRLPLGGRGLLPALDALDPDVVLLHAPFWKAPDVCRLVHLKGGITVMVHHGFARVDPSAAPVASPVLERALRAWLHRTYDEADAVMAVGDPWEDTGRGAAIALRYGVARAFQPQPAAARAGHVLSTGAVPSGADWRALAADCAEPERARELAAAACLVVPADGGAVELRALEAIACGTPAVVPAGSSTAAAAGESAITFLPTEAGDLERAVERARGTRPAAAAAAAFAAERSWERMFGLELRELETLARW